MLQLRDGRILVHSDQGGNANSWYILTPDSKGNFATGTWSGPFNMQSTYSPFFFSSGVLLDGKTILTEGGEYNFGSADWTTLGSLGTLTPWAGITWVANTPPTGWGTIGDAQSILLQNGQYLQANCCTAQTAFYNGPNSWTTGPSVLAVRNDESGYTALPNGNVLMVDVQTNSNCSNSTKSTEYLAPPYTAWACGPQTTQQMWQQSDQELGSAVLFYPNANHPKGGVFQYGGNVTATNVLDIAANTWATGPTLDGMDQADGPGALEPNGLVLEQVSPGLFNSGCEFQEFDPVAGTLTKTVSNGYCPGDSSYEGHLMIFPSGQIGSVDFGTQIYLYNPKPGVAAGVAPTIIPASNAYLGGSKNNTLYGIQLNGLSGNNAYGDDYQMATNYPLIKFTDSNNNVYWGFTHDDSSHSIAPGTVSYTKFDINPATPPGTYTMQVVTNGIASNAVTVKIH
ncbi:MAG: hypothetical protein WAM71_14400 [Candidatus Korobacteraceae bacterium]